MTRSARRQRSAPAARFTLESLEPRVLLSASIDVDLLQHDVNPVWFAEVNPPRATQDAGGSALQSVNAADVMWDGQSVSSAADQWIIRLDDAVADGVASLESVVDLLDLNTFGAQVVRGLGLEGMVLLETDSATDTELLITTLKTHDLIAYAQPNVIIDAQLFGSDPYFDNLYGLHNEGQSGGTVDADIDAPEAWELTTGSSSVVVGVIDTGIDYTHPDLAANIWTNPGEIAGNGIDDDGNGFVDDIHGFDFANNDGDPMDDNGHGTHVAGTIAAAGDNGTGIVGVTWSTSVMALKFLSGSGSGTTADAVRAINYATMMRTQYGVDVRVTNNSWGGGGPSNALRDAILASEAADMLFIAAAGNEGANNDATNHYPSNYDLDSVIAVAATDRNDNLANFSNYGETTVDLAAPGVSILSTLPDNRYAYYSGTSMATPHVAGVAALAFAHAPDATAAQVRDAILTGVDLVPGLDGDVATGGRLNAYNTLMALDAEPIEPGEPDAYEDNDTRQQVDGDVNANLGLLLEAITIDNLNTDDGDADWFRFEMNGAGRDGDQVRIDFDHAQANLDLTVYAADGSTVVGSSASQNDFESVSLTGAAAGTYYVFVRGFAGARSENYQLSIDPGASASVSGAVTADGAGVGDVTVYIDENDNGQFDHAAFTVAATGLPIDVPANGTFGQALSTLDVAADGARLVDLDVTLDIDHTWDSDLDVYLISPTGTRVELFTDIGGSGDGFNGTVLDDEANDSIANGDAPFTGRFRPEGFLADFDGELIDGQWTLEINDDAFGDRGTLNGWSLSFTVSETHATTNDNGQYTLSDLPDGDAIVRIVAPEGMQQVSPDDAHRVTLTAAAQLNDIDFNLTSDAPAPTTPNIELLGNGHLIADGDQTPDATDGTAFGSVDVALGAATHRFTIRNTGDGDLDLTGDNPIAISDSAFTLVGSFAASTLAPGQTVSFDVRFDPSQVGAHDALLTIASNDADTPVYDFVLAGTGIAPDLAPTDLTYAAGDYAHGQTLALSADVTNLGASAINAGSGVVVEFRLSADTTWGNGDDVVLGSKVFSAGFDLSALSQTQLDAVIGEGIAAGDYHVAVMVDAHGSIDEQDETNNVLFSAAADVTVVEHVVLDLESGRAVTFDDADGDRVTVYLVGPGSGQIILDGRNGFDAGAITLNGTSARSSLLIYGDTTIGDITVDGGLNMLYAAQTDLLDTVDLNGGARYVHFDDLSGATILLGEYAGATTIIVDEVTNSAIDAASDIGYLRMASWDGGALSATRVGTFYSSGDVTADVTLTGDSHYYTLSYAYVGGALTDAVWNIDGRAATIFANATDGVTLDGMTQLHYLNLGVAGGVDVSVDGHARFVTAHRWDSGSLTAHSLRSLAVYGHMGATVTLTGDNSYYTLGSAYIAGALQDVTWQIAGRASVINAAATDGFTLENTTSIHSLLLGDAGDVQIDVDGRINYVRAYGWASGSLTAHSLGTLAVYGDMGATVTLVGDDSYFTLGSTYVSGALENVTWQVTGRAAKLYAGATDGFALQNVTEIYTLLLGEAGDVEIGVDGRVHYLMARGWETGSLTAASLGSLIVLGDHSADLTLDDSLTYAYVAGALHDATWQVGGQAGTIVATQTDQFSLTVAGDVRALILGDVTHADLAVEGRINYLRADGYDSGVIEADSMGTMVVVGDLGADVTLTGSRGAYSLGVLHVLGLMSDATVRTASSIGGVVAHRMNGARVFAGVEMNATKLPDTAGAFVNREARIGYVVVTGHGAVDDAAVVDSAIAAWRIGSASLHSVRTDNDAVAFGVAASRIDRFFARNDSLRLIDTDGDDGDFRLRLV